MILIDCTPCQHRHLVADRDVLSLHTTSEGVIGYVRCPESKTILIHNFTTAATLGAAGRPTDPAPASAPTADPHNTTATTQPAPAELAPATCGTQAA